MHRYAHTHACVWTHTDKDVLIKDPNRYSHPRFFLVVKQKLRMSFEVYRQKDACARTHTHAHTTKKTCCHIALTASYNNLSYSFLGLD